MPLFQAVFSGEARLKLGNVFSKVTNITHSGYIDGTDLNTRNSNVSSSKITIVCITGTCYYTRGSLYLLMKR